MEELASPGSSEGVQSNFRKLNGLPPFTFLHLFSHQPPSFHSFQLSLFSFIDFDTNNILRS